MHYDLAEASSWLSGISRTDRQLHSTHSKVVRIIMINIRCTQKQKVVSNHKLLPREKLRSVRLKRCNNLLRHCLQLYRKERGESFYNNMLPDVVEDLQRQAG